MTLIKYLIFFLIILFLLSSAETDVHAQFIPVHTTNVDIYSFIDELANDGAIDINSCIKPWSRMQIAKWLEEAMLKPELLSQRQLKEVDFYLKQFILEERTKNKEQRAISDNRYQLTDNRQKDSSSTVNRPLSTAHYFSINPIAFTYIDSTFRLQIEPIWGATRYINSSQKLTHTYGGASGMAYIAKGWSFYANVRDNSMSGAALVQPTYFTQLQGGDIKTDLNLQGSSDYSEMRGGFNYAFKWGNVGLVKDHVQWGDNYHGASIFSGRTPSFPMIRLQLTPVNWMQFNYYHGWLVSEVIDSSRSYVDLNSKIYRATFRQKYIAANMFSFRLHKGLWFSFGNSIVYSDMNAHPGYLIPFLFYKSVDHEVNWGIENQNSQMFFNISARTIRHLHLYASAYIDEWSFSRIGNPNRHNFTSEKIGFNLTDWPIKNISFISEYTQSSPMTYKHKMQTTTFESNKYNLGWYLRDNSTEKYFAVLIKPYAKLNITLYANKALHGNEYAYKTGYEDSLQVMKNISWSSDVLGGKVSYQLVNNMFFTASFEQNNTQGFNVDGKTAEYYLALFTSPFYRGRSKIISLSFNINF